MALLGERTVLTIKGPMGHKTLGMTMRYAHLIPDQKRKVVTKDRSWDHLLLYEETRKALATLTPRQEKILRMRYALDEKRRYSRKEIAESFGISYSTVRRIELTALRLLRHPSRQRELKGFVEEGEDAPEGLTEHPIELVDIVSAVSRLSVHLIQHLKLNPADIPKLPWDVFEHLIAEFFASWGYEEVRLVGRDSNTSADIYAVQKVDPIGVRIRYYVEVKRWKDKIGVDVIDRVYGAVQAERPKHGWHMAMIVSLVGFKEFKKYSRVELTLKGIELKDRDAVTSWLRDYRPTDKGLWLPPMLLT